MTTPTVPTAPVGDTEVSTMKQQQWEGKAVGTCRYRYQEHMKFLNKGQIN